MSNLLVIVAIVSTHISWLIGATVATGFVGLKCHAAHILSLQTTLPQSQPVPTKVTLYDSRTVGLACLCPVYNIPQVIFPLATVRRGTLKGNYYATVQSISL